MKKRVQGRHPESAFGGRRIQCIRWILRFAQNDKLNILMSFLAILLVFASCTGEQKGIETTTPEPLEEISIAMDGGTVGKYMLSVGKEGKSVLQKLDDAGNVVAEEAVTVLVANDQFDFTALDVRVTGTVDADGKIISITITDIKTGNSVTASISYIDTKAATEPQTVEEKKTETTETPDGGGGGGGAVPVEYPKWNMVTARDMHACAIKDDKTVWCFGMNSNGQLGFATETPTQSTPKQVPGISDAVLIKTGTARTCVITGTKETWCWGNGNATPKKVDELKGIASLSFVGDDIYTTTASAAIKVSMAVAPYTVTVIPLDVPKKIAAVTSGFYFLESDGDVKYWDVGGVVTQKSSNAVDIAAYDGGADSPACAVDNTAQAVCWGTPSLPSVSSVGAVALGGSQRCVIKNDKSLWWHEFNKPLQKIDIGSVKSAALGQAHVCAIDSSGYMWCWGSNASGQLGDGTTTSRDTPVKLK